MESRRRRDQWSSSISHNTKVKVYTGKLPSLKQKGFLNYFYRAHHETWSRLNTGNR